MDQEQITETINHVMELATAYGLQVVGAIIILILGWIAAGWARNAADKGLSKVRGMDETLRYFLSTLVRYLVLAVTIVMVLERFGVQTASLIAVLGAAGLAIGLALQGTLSNLAAGVMLLFFRPFKIGDFVDAAGISGTVKLISLFTTEMATPDNVKIIVPNKQLWDTSIKNFSANATRRVDFLLGIGYGDDIDKAFKVIKEIIENDERCHKEPESQIVVGNLGDSSVDIIVRVWCKADDYWGLKFDLTKAFKQTFDKEGIEIPFPQRVVHMVKEGANDA
ncbi:mechanosensitive ion channel [Hwanghaeella grinnelliae]|uniref:Small-conductance mechanosensitive channel n=1 Tax=Hwanghaeella grinnelliae TaxID=2500179 RepID=A0A437QTJ3_9PROT|nr:mechanosensitive ion channel domain-containing protein [Hwanghaeella grinnelliae]RVU37804.1 mechanosensitive ion channel [Hwanghaeella grinnelliae]